MSDLDLTKEAVSPVGDVGPLDPGGLKIRRAGFEDRARLMVAMALIGLLAVVVLATAGAIINTPGDEMPLEAFLKLVFTPLIGLVGSVVGFYFGARSAGDNAQGQ